MLWIWLGFIAFVLLLLALDLGVFHREAHVVSVREAFSWSALWITLGLSFAVFVYYGYENQWLGLGTTPDIVDKSPDYPEGRVNDGRSAVLKYLTGYVVEKSLSVDNVFVIAMIFGFLAVPAIYQHRVLFWGILGALVLRGVMIGVGARLIADFSWILYVFGAFLILTAVKMLVMTENTDPNETADRPAHPARLRRDREIPRRALLRARRLRGLRGGRYPGSATQDDAVVRAPGRAPSCSPPWPSLSSWSRAPTWSSRSTRSPPSSPSPGIPSSSSRATSSPSWACARSTSPWREPFGSSAISRSPWPWCSPSWG